MNSLQHMFETIFAAAAFGERGLGQEARALRDERRSSADAKDTRPASRPNQKRPRMHA